MLILANFSHPLSNAAKAALSEKWGDGDEIHEVVVRCQVDFDTDLVAQVDAMIGEALADQFIIGNPRNIDMIIPPALSFAAAILPLRIARLTGSRYIPNIVVMARDGDALSPRFMPVTLIGA